MRILVLCKRQYTGRDLLDDQYGRLFEIPEALARRDHQVHGTMCSYRRRSRSGLLSAAGVEWTSFNAVPFGLLHAMTLRASASAWKPDVIWAGSDAPHCVAGVQLANALQVPVVLDLYDNYDHFALTKLPGLRSAYLRACNRATALTVASQTLARHVESHIARTTPSFFVPNGVVSEHFRPLNRTACRASLGLPVNARLIGTAGALDESRGIDDLFQAFVHLAEQDASVHLVVAGPRDDTLGRYLHPRIIDLGHLPWQQVPVLINALDLSIVCNRDSTFGRYCCPLKLHEAIACEVPVVAAAVGDTPRILQDEPQALYAPGHPLQLAERILAQLNAPPGPLPGVTRSWDELATVVESALTHALGRH